MKRGAKIAIGAGVLVVVAGLIAWPVAALAETGAISITTDARPLVCAKGQEVDQKQDSSYVELAKITPDTDCLLRVHIANNGIFPVHIASATYPLLGSGSLVAHVDFIDGLLAATNNQGLDATGQLQNGDVAPGQVVTLVAHVTYAKSACMADRSFETVSDSPTLALTALGIRETRMADRAIFGFLGTKLSSPACKQYQGG